MGGAAPPEAEQRANAFAAELLLPAEEAGRAFAKGRDPATAVRDLTKRFGSSKQIIAWQAIRSGWQLSSSTRAYLRNLLPDEEDRQRFDSAYNPP
jgi:Zn-dependent peptidase ImmA (M78 family)